MNPAFSVIFFTTASGAGYGLLIVAGVLSILGELPPDTPFAVATMGIALAAVTAGLLASTFHLGHPERAWRALSQWRSSWLSREGVMAIATYIPALGFGGSWILPGLVPGPRGAWATAMIVCALTTVFTTAMIYRSLKPIPQWYNGWVVANYLLLGPMSGAVILSALVTTASGTNFVLAALVVSFICGAWARKSAYWRTMEQTGLPDAGSALGLPGQRVRSVEWPHTERNYLLKEMGFAIGRKHAEKLRRFSVVTAFIAPLALTVGAAFLTHSWAILATWIAAFSAVTGVVVERWLFFAEAQHSVTLYYKGSAD
ncbi:MAG: dimethyl sulfoxide reductase anchor subunit [Rhodobacteraceae bacterium]|nr:dimethyl sulfoxide reductase anchor subunit [Paracoccaceae bacterium]